MKFYPSFSLFLFRKQYGQYNKMHVYLYLTETNLWKLELVDWKMIISQKFSLVLKSDLFRITLNNSSWI